MMIWYKNSILASIFSLAGCSGVVAGIYELMNAQYSELSIPEIIGLMAVSVLLAVIGNRISAHKQKKKQTRAATFNTGAAQPQYASAYAAPQANAPSNAQAAVPGKPVKGSIVAAGILFALIMLLNYLGDRRNLHASIHTHPISILEYMMYLLLVVAAFHTRATQKISMGYVIGFLGLTLPGIQSAIYYFGSETPGIISNYTFVGIAHSIQILAYFMMALFAIFAIRSKMTGGNGFVRALSWLPALLLLASYFMLSIDGYDSILGIIQRTGWIGLQNVLRHPAYRAVCTFVSSTLAVFLTGICLRHFCQAPEIVFQPSAAYTQAAPQYEPPVPPASPQPQPEPVQPRRASAPAQSAAAPAHPQEAEKMREAYRDLLDMGILTPEEYDQKMRELTGRESV